MKKKGAQLKLVLSREGRKTNDDGADLAPLTTLDLFCGAGGITEGFREAGYRCLYGNDCMPEAVETFSENHPEAWTLMTSQLPVSKWHGQIGDATVADSILDRLVHAAHRLELNGESLRKLRGERGVGSEGKILGLNREARGAAGPGDFWGWLVALRAPTTPKIEESTGPTREKS